MRDIVFKRLQLLQTQMTRHVNHFGGLNPRGHRFVLSLLSPSLSLTFHLFARSLIPHLRKTRIVKNDSVSRAITKGILDGELLAEFEALPLGRQVELTKSVGTDPDTVLANLKGLGTVW